jgi:ABC-type uncharacterized transport system ATPase subunit
MKSFEKSDTKLILVGKDVRDIASGNVSTWKMMQQLFTPEAANVTYLGVVPYKNKDTLLKQRYVCFQHLQTLPVSWIEAMAMEKLLSLPILAGLVK